METQNSNEVVVLMVPFPAQGHLNQLLHLSHLISSYGLSVHYAGSAIHNRQVMIRLDGRKSESLNNIHFHDFEIPDYISPPPDPNHSTHFPTHLEPLFDIPTHLKKPISQLLQELSSKFKRVIVIFDSLMTSVAQVGKSISNVESYVFSSVSTFTIFSNIWDSLPEKPFQLDSDFPTCIPSNEGCFTTKVFDFMMSQRKLLGFEAGFLYNTTRVIEGKYVELLEKLSVNPNTKHFAIGPLNPVKIESENGNERHECLKWLDEKEKNSVIFVSFGSTTSMIDDQIKELALGLEKSGQKFIWVLRKADRTDVFSGNSEEGKSQLPQGFENRVKNRGIVREWVPQVQILGHPSIGGFMSHCGWNSCMESISSGVLMVAWPMHSDQPKNATLITEVLKIGKLVRDWKHRSNLVTSNTIEKVVKTMMASEEGDEMRRRALELGESVRASVSNGGVSRLEVDSFVSHITR